MTQWVRLCSVGEAPGEGQVMEAEAAGFALCVANVGGKISAMDNCCPHRHGPLGQGWVEGNAVVCPWHSWAFDVCSGVADYPENEHVKVFPVKVEGGDLLVELEPGMDSKDLAGQVDTAG